MSIETSFLNQPAISGCYLFPQSRFVDSPFAVTVPGAVLACYRRIVNPEVLTLVHFHGNGEAVADYVPDFADQCERLGLNSLFVEYRAYGRSTGRAELAAMLGDGERALEAAGIPFQSAVVMGRSIGSLYALELANRHPEIAGLIIESGIADLGQRLLMRVDLQEAGVTEREFRAEIETHFDHRKKLETYTGPLLILHAEHDDLVDVSHAERNFAWSASQNKHLVRFPMGNHNSIMGVNFLDYFQQIRRFVNGLRSD